MTIAYAQHRFSVDERKHFYIGLFNFFFRLLNETHAAPGTPGRVNACLYILLIIAERGKRKKRKAMGESGHIVDQLLQQSAFTMEHEICSRDDVIFISFIFSQR